MLDGRRVYDCFPFWRELDLLDLRLHELAGVVDRFVLAEARFTHQGKPKPLYFDENRDRFAPFLDRIDHIVVTDFPEADFAKLGESWKYERHQRDALARGLIDCGPDDIVIHSDVDEIPSAQAVRAYDPAMGFMGLDQSLHVYWLNLANRETRYDWAKIFTYGCTAALGPLWTLCQIRYLVTNAIPAGGWHFSFMGDIPEVVAKIEAWSHQEYNIAAKKTEEHLRRCMADGIDPHGRTIRYRVERLDERYPRYLREHPECFRHLLKELAVPTIEWNREVFDQKHPWVQDGDEWTEMAAACGVPYDQWKRELAQTFFVPVGPSHTVLEIGPGHGRWSELLVRRLPTGKLILVDMSAACAARCRERFKDVANVEIHVNDGLSIPMVPSESVDFIWSFDTFVHLEPAETEAYVCECARVLKRRAMGCLHHPGTPTAEQRARGARSAVTAKQVIAWLHKRGLYVVRQTDSWGTGCNVKLNADVLTVFAKP